MESWGSFVSYFGVGAIDVQVFFLQYQKTKNNLLSVER